MPSPSVGGELPVGADAGGHVQRHGEIDRVLHGVAHQARHLLGFAGGYLHHEFVVDLQDDTATKLALASASDAWIMAIFMMSAAEP